MANVEELIEPSTDGSTRSNETGRRRKWFRPGGTTGPIWRMSGMRAPTHPAAALVPADLWGSEAGGRWFEGNAGGTIERCEAPSLLAVTWEYGGEISWVEVQLSRSQQGRRSAAAHSPPFCRTVGRVQASAVGVGWDTALGLGLHLESGKAIDRPKRKPGWPLLKDRLRDGSQPTVG